MTVVRQATFSSCSPRWGFIGSTLPDLQESSRQPREFVNDIISSRQSDRRIQLMTSLSVTCHLVHRILEAHLRAAMQGPRNLFPYERTGGRHRGARACMRPVGRWPRARIPPSVSPDTGQSTRSGHLRPGYWGLPPRVSALLGISSISGPNLRPFPRLGSRLRLSIPVEPLC